MEREIPKKKIVFLIPPKVHLLDLSGSAHVFYEAKEAGIPLDIIFATINDEVHLESSAGLNFSNLNHVEEVELSENDFVFIPGSEEIFEVIKANTHFLKILNSWNKNRIHICSICVGVFWLAEAGILNGKKSTTHWRYIDRLKALYPETFVQDDALFIIEDHLFMSAGVSSGIDLSLYILEILYGYELSLQLSQEIVYYFRRAGGDPQLSNFIKYRNHIDTTVHRVQDFITNNLNTKFNLDDLASELNMSKRNLSRKFKNATQLTIGEYRNMLRIERAKHLLSKGYKMQAVAIECGYKSVNQLKALLD